VLVDMNLAYSRGWRVVINLLVVGRVKADSC
jgi:hypothetical protein